MSIEMYENSQNGHVLVHERKSILLYKDGTELKFSSTHFECLISQDPKTYVVWYLIKKSLHLFSWCNNQVSKPFGWKEAILKPSRQLHVNNRNIRKRCEICSKLTIKTPWRRSGVFIVHFEHISHLVLVFPLLTLSR